MTQNDKIARIFKAYCDPNRLAILNLLQHGERCGCELLEKLAIGQPTLSHHMKILCDSEIVTLRKLGKMAFYSIDQEGVQRSKEYIDMITEVLANSPSAYA